MKDTVKINNKEYLKGKEAVKDILTERWIIKKDAIKVAIDCEKDDDGKVSKVIYGFTRALDANERLIQVIRADGNIAYVVNEELCDKMGIEESIKDGEFYEDIDMQGPQRNWQKFENTQKPFPFQLVYDPKALDISESTRQKIIGDAIKWGGYSQSNLIAEGRQYTFGVEIETSEGFIPDRVARNYNMRTVHDGSISGGEYVTGVLYGDRGFHHLQQICNELNRRTKINKKCGLHVHIGSPYEEMDDGTTMFNKEFTVFAYIFALKIQKDLALMMPASRRPGNSEWAERYCKNMPDRDFRLFYDAMTKGRDKYKEALTFYYNDIFEQILRGKQQGIFIGPSYNKKQSHPDGRWCAGRYYWLNFVGFNFHRDNTNGAFTVEFRNHSATTNYEKIKNWILICMAMVYYIQNNRKSIIYDSELTIEEVIKFSYRKNTRSLLEYINSRKLKFKTVKGEEIEYDTDALDADTLKKKMSITETVGLH